MLMDGLFIGYMLKAMAPKKANVPTKQSNPEDDGMPPVHEEQVVVAEAPQK